MDLVTIVVVVVVVVVIVALLVAFLTRRQRQGQEERQERAREEYGSEYERVAEERGSEKEAEKELRERRERVEGEIRPLSSESQRRYEERWRGVEQSFVDEPRASVDEADRVVAEILAERNFPAKSREDASGGVGVMYPGVVEDFREAQRIYGEADQSDLEEMRRAIQKYRSVYERLIER